VRVPCSRWPWEPEGGLPQLRCLVHAVVPEPLGFSSANWALCFPISSHCPAL
jgi:hypothetical protein